ncbi:hypothetical protein ACFV2N_36765 [Streptomyces sp. NPDC059680]|uniref:hypothetical protein n=1 Tax=Streptomyces sp. NPDC059680 TaxID=3346904 RepID=UPI00369F654F
MASGRVRVGAVGVADVEGEGAGGVVVVAEGGAERFGEGEEGAAVLCGVESVVREGVAGGALAGERCGDRHRFGTVQEVRPPRGRRRRHTGCAAPQGLSGGPHVSLKATVGLLRLRRISLRWP